MPLRKLAIVALAAFAALISARTSSAAQTRPPNVIVILSDDVGYGDLGCYGAKRIKTPNLDRLANDGLRFTDAHSPSATCTPTRYALLTGEYAWRKPGTGILPGDANLIIAPGRPTVPSIMRQAGYTTGCVGKWHLGLGSGKIDWNGDIKPGPLEIGFDYCFIIPATGDRVPCVFVENHRIVGLDPADPIAVSYQGKIGNEPTGRENPGLLKMKLSQGHDNTIVNGISRIGFMSGGHAAWWKDEDIADTITAKATAFIEKNKDRPFFLYFATHDVHVPRVPHPRFKGTSQCGVRGDAIQQLDACVGKVRDTLQRLNIADNTLIIFTSDNGPVINDGYADGSIVDLNGHTPAGPLKGGKYSLYEGGTRMPFIACWPGHIKPGTSDALVCQVDFLASFAALTGQSLSNDAGPDSFNILPALLGESKTGRDTLVEHANGTALRKGQWKLIPAARPAAARRAAAATRSALPELYDLSNDLSEKKNVAADHPDIVKEMSALLAQLRQQGRSRPAR